MNIKAKFQELVRLVEMAGVYMEDGAFRTSADRLRKAAAIAEELADQKDQLLQAIVQAGGATS